MDSRPRELDVIICDEAHRLREKSVNQYTSRERRAKARPQIEEIIDTAYVPVFLLDEHQVVRPGEMGTVAEITAVAGRLGCGVELVKLDGQYRCGGSALFDRWVLALLDISGFPVPWNDDSFEVSCAESPSALEDWMAHRSGHRGGTARMAAGFC